MKKIQCKADFLNIAKKFIQGIGKGFKMLSDMGLQIEQDAKDKENNTWSIKLGTGDTMKCQVAPIDKTGSRVDLIFKNTNTGETRKFSDVPRKADVWFNKATEAAEDLYGPAFVEDMVNTNTGEYIADKDEKDVDSSTHTFKAKLSKVMCSDGVEGVFIHSMHSGNPVDDREILDRAMTYQEFVDTLSEDPKYYEFVDGDDSFDVNECECCECSDDDIVAESIICCMKEALSMMVKFQYLAWNLLGGEYFYKREDLKHLAYTMGYHVEHYADFLSQMNRKVPDLYSECDSCRDNDYVNYILSFPADGTGDEVFSDFLRSELCDYIKAMDTVYCNLPHDIAAVFDRNIQECKQIIADKCL